MDLKINDDEVVIRTSQGIELAVSYELMIRYADTAFQKQLVHEASNILFTTLGREKGKKYFRFYQTKLFREHTGMTMEDAQKIAKEKRAASNQRKGGRNAIRSLYPDIASAMAFSDYLVSKGIDIDEAIRISKEMAPAFDGISSSQLV